jgi:protein-ribulosamine 3-kinase
MSRWHNIEAHISEATGQSFSNAQHMPLAGGSINTAFLLSSGGRQYFVKTNRSGMRAMFKAEAKGLNEIAATDTIMVPEAICYGDDDQQSYIVMQYIPMQGSANQVQLGQQLAAMHMVTQRRYGWDIDNTIGDTHQPNQWTDSWLDFWRDRRLGYQLALAAENGYGGELQTLGDRLMAALPALLADHETSPSMLHGDLWGGNVSGMANGTPVIFDPAFYYGDRETDIAMTHVFGGFSNDFYASYNNAWPLPDGFSTRKTLYNLYHILNHTNIFGGGYHSQAIAMLKQLLAEVG